MFDDTQHAAVHRQQFHEHEQLFSLLLEIESLLQSAQARLELVRERLTEFQRRLAEHFTFEEQEGLFYHVSAMAPQLQTRAARLAAEHAQLAQMLTGLIDRAARTYSSADLSAVVGAEFAAFRQRLTQHEAAEHELLHAAYGQDSAEGD